MNNLLRPYLIIPKLIQQKTWGGDYISQEKGIELNGGLPIKLGQSYELFSGSKLMLVNEGKQFDVGHPDSEEIDKSMSSPMTEVINLSELILEEPASVLGIRTANVDSKMPLLLKLTQAKGNSFQLHIKPGLNDPRWLPKSETWYFFEKGKVTCGITPGISIRDYQESCVTIDNEMQLLSRQINEQKITIEEARAKASELVRVVNPWQFVQTKDTSTGDVFDMSRGGIHHSWEEELSNLGGNILYEVQQDRMDPISTIRSFDQGKIGDDGKVREINIDDYFKYLDTSSELNQGDFSGNKLGGDNVFTTKDYAMDVVEFEKVRVDSTNDSFCHYFVKEGKMKVETNEGWVMVEKGWSCFVPAIAASKVTMKSLDSKTTVLKTYVPKDF